MGRSIFQVDQLGGALDSVRDRVMFIPKGRRLLVDNAHQKIVILLEGQVKASVNGKAVGDMAPGDALVVPGPCKQSYVPLVARREMRMHVLVVVFRRGLFAFDETLLRAVPAAGAKADDSPEDFIREHFGRVQVRRDVLTPAVRAAIEALRREASAKAAGFRMRAAAQVLLLLSEIARREELELPAARKPLSRQQWMVEQVKNFVMEHLTEELTLEQIAWHVRLSGEHLARTFRKETGRTIFGYLQHLRIEQAKAQLAGSQLTVNEIARVTGFGSASHLCRAFKQATGGTPVAYRLRTAKDAQFSPSVMDEVVA